MCVRVRVYACVLWHSLCNNFLGAASIIASQQQEPQQEQEQQHYFRSKIWAKF